MSIIRRFTQFIFSTVIILSLSLSMSQPKPASAQGWDGIQRQVNAETGRVSFIGPVSGRVVSASRALGFLARPVDPAMALAKRFAPEFGLQNPERELTEMKANHPGDGRMSVRYQQNYEGIPVMAGELIVNTNENGDLYSMNGEVSPDLSLSTQPTIDSAQARESALQAAAKWYEKTPEDFLASEPELWIFDESLLHSSTRAVELVWRMEVTSVDNSLPLRELVLINAQRGSISLHFNQIDTAWSTPASIGTNDIAQDANPTETPTETAILTETLIPLQTTTPMPTESLPPTKVIPRQSSSDEIVALAGATWYAATTGNNSNSCSTPTSPCLTINGSIGKATNGDTIKVAIGTYTGTGTEEVVLINKSITLSGGWNASFNTRNGTSTIDGQGSRQGVVIWSGITTVIGHFTIQNGLATFTASGGGIFNSGSLTLNNSFIKNNRASGGGGIYASSSSNTTINNSAIYFNTAVSTYGGGYGGGIAGGYYESLHINNSTISNNAAEDGGGIYKNTSSNLINLNNVTISENHAKRDGGGIYSGSSATVVLKNTILANNTSLAGGANCNISSLVLDGRSILYPQTCSYSGGSPMNVNPQLGTFIPSAGYYPLILGSPAINAGSLATCTATDQRGVARPVGAGCDIGAYEYTAPGSVTSLVILDGNNQRTSPTFTFPKPLKAVALDNQGSPVPAVNITFTAPGSGASVKFINTNTNIMSALTDARGAATTSTFVANSQTGIYTISASASGVGSINFNLENGAWYVSPSGNDANNCSTSASPCGTINGAINKPTVITGDMIFVAEGTYYGSSFEVVTLNKNVTLAGGWNQSFTSRTGFSIIDGQGSRRGIKVYTDINASIDHFMVRNGYAGEYVDGTGGGIWNDGNLIINSSSIHNNMAFGTGGGIWNLGTLGLNNTTVNNNMAADQGGGILNGAGTITLNNSTISNNIATSYSSLGGGIYNYGGITIKNSILADNIDGNESPNCYGNGTITSLGYNIIGHTSGCAITATAGDKFNVNPKLATFLPTQGYQPLQFGSPAINGGNSQTCYGLTDQRGVTRVGICDIGAYEYTVAGIATNLVILDGNNQRTPPTFAFSKVLKVIALDNQGSPVQGINVTFTTPSNGASAAFTDTNANTSSIITDSGGVAATSTLVANNLLGTYVISASASGVSSINFSLENGARYVTPTGNDANSCASPASPCSTISGAINKASDGDTILIALGTYNGSGGISIFKDLLLSGGWNNGFTSQNGQSTIQGSFGVGGMGDYYIRTSVVAENLTVSNSITSAGVTNSGTLTFHNGSIINNSMGIDNYGDLTVVNSTISGNGTSTSSRGGIHNQSPIGPGVESSRAVVKIINSTVTNNQGNETGGIFNGSSSAGLVILQNSIVAGNNAAPGFGPDCFGGNPDGKFISLGGNIIGDIGPFIAGAGYRCKAVWLGTDLIGDQNKPVNANINVLTNLGNNVWVHPLKLGSPALDGGLWNDCLPIDQRGVTRPQSGTCDSGAYEYVFDHNLNNLLITTYNVANTISLPGTFICDQTDLNCTAGDIQAKAAHKYAAGTYSLFKNQHNRNSIDGNGIEIISSVHYGSNYQNAFWNGYMMIYGDGYGFPLADDVVAHELTHGVTQYESNLFPYYQSGAINESFSDLWGEYYDQTNSQGNDTAGVKWLLGEDTSGLGAIRNMINPPALGDPDKMSSANYHQGEDDSGGVHHNSGVNNKAVFLMVDGGTFNGKTVSTLGWVKTSSIYYEANTNLLSSGADYSDLYFALQQACSNMIGQKGITSSDCLEVKDAIDAVEMNGQPAANFNTDAPLCSVAGTIPRITFADDLESGTAKWTFSNGDFTRWQLDSPYGRYAHSGEHFLYADDDPAAITDSSARLTSFVVPGNSYLHFAHAYEFETGYLINDPTLYNFDGGVLEYSINGGSTWLDAGSLIDYNGYKGTIFAGVGNPLSSRSAFVGSSHGYISTRLNLASLAGKSVTFRWRMGLDAEVAALGWWVDDIRLYTCGPGVFNKTSPSNGGTGVSLSTTLSWTNSSTATSYQYCYDIINDNLCNSSWSTPSTATSAIISNLGANTAYYWQVRASNAGGTTYADNQTWRIFTTTPTLLPGTVGIDVFMGTSKRGSYSLGSNQNISNRYGINGGPVLVSSTDGTTPIFTSQRAIFGSSFNSIVGYPADQLTTDYWFTSYDDLGMITYLVIGNPHPSNTAEVDVYIGGNKMNATPYSIPPGQRIFPRYGINAGPVHVVSTNGVNIFTSERTKFGNSFNEVMGYPGNQLTTDYWFTSYDDVGMITYLVIGNPHPSNTAEVDVYIAGVKKNATPYSIAPGQRIFPRYAINGGPVQVVSTNGVDIFTSERSKFGQSFNEVLGYPANQFTTDYWFTSYDDASMITYIVIGNPHPTLTAEVDVYIAGTLENTYSIAPGQRVFPRYGVNSGPVHVVSTNGVDIFTSERSKYLSSFNEILGLPDNQLTTDYWFTSYDDLGMTTYLIIAAP